MTEIKDTSAVFVSKTVRDVINDVIPVAEAAVIAAQPWMGTPVLKEVWEEIFKILVTQLGDSLGTMGAFMVMDVQKYQAVVTASETLAALQAAQQSGDSNAIAKARLESDAAAAQLLHYHGDAHR